MDVYKRVEDEIFRYLNGYVDLSDGVRYSEYKTKNRIALFEEGVYPDGKIDEQGRYRYWFDIIAPRVNDEVKNLRVDTEHFKINSFSPRADHAMVTLLNLKNKVYMEDTAQASELKDDLAVFSSWGNVLWKKCGQRWVRADLKNVMLTNVTARSLDNTDVIERHELTAGEVRKKEADGWKNIDAVLKNLGDRQFSATYQSSAEETTAKRYEFFERVGELTEYEYNQIHDKKGGSENKTVLCKVIFAGLRKGVKDHKYVVFAEKIKDKTEVYIEAHRGAYRGRWFRKGLYETLFDCQVRANEIGNDIANGLGWASLAVFRASDNQTYDNIKSDMEDGQLIQSADFQQVPIRMQSLDQLIADWNRNLEHADRLANSFEIVSGEELKSNTPFRLARQLNDNANKLFVILRQQFVFGYRRIYNEQIIPNMLKNLRAKDVIELTGDESVLRSIYRMVANHWFNANLAKIGPVASDQQYRDEIIKFKMNELAQTELTLKIVDKEIFTGLNKRLFLTITGENDTSDEELEDIANFLNIEQRPGVREYLIERAYMIRGFDIPEEAKATQPAQPGTQPGQPAQLV